MPENIETKPDILENSLREQYPEEFQALLFDHTTQKNIIWATDNYEELGEKYSAKSEILPELITGEHGTVIMPRVQKERDLQTARVRDMAEVFTPTWVCNAQNNLIDDAWFGYKEAFNREYVDENGTPCWQAKEGKIEFPEEPSRSSKRSWQDYVRDTRLEITCGEGPYLVSRYDRVTGEFLTDLNQRVGILDRKLRVVSENTETTGDWFKWTKEALKATYGFEWQGDNLLLAREALFFTVLDFYHAKFGSMPSGVQAQSLPGVAYIISWNLWQMDGLKMVVPYSCEGQEETNLFGETTAKTCPACEKGEQTGHIGIPCLIRDWKKPREKQKIEFRSLFSAQNR